MTQREAIVMLAQLQIATAKCLDLIVTGQPWKVRVRTVREFRKEASKIQREFSTKPKKQRRKK
jgi:hypothetical protein